MDPGIRIAIPQNNKRKHPSSRKISNTPHRQLPAAIAPRATDTVLETRLLTHPSTLVRVRSNIILNKKWVWRGTPCWIWIGDRDRKGYGLVNIGQIRIPTHRLLYIIAKGAIPKDNQIDHKCRNKSCCNPRHLEAVTEEENLKRAGHHYTMNWKRGNKSMHLRGKHTTYYITRKIQPPPNVLQRLKSSDPL